MTRRLLRWIAGIILILLAVPVLAVAIVLLTANVEPGRRFIEKQTASLTGGMVRIEGLSGRFPDALRANRIEVSDAKGPYVSISGLVLDWSPLKLLQRTALVDRLQVDQLDFTRLPEAETKTSSSSGSFNLPVQVVLRRLHVARAVIGAPVAGVAATLTLDGAATLQTLTEGTVQLDVQRVDSPGHYVLNGRVSQDAIVATLKANEPAKGLISGVAHLPDLGAISIEASVNGPRDAMGTQVGITAGQLTASASGTVDLEHEAAALAIKAQAPAMAPAAGVSWQSVLVDATVRGPFTKPDANGTIKIDSLNAAGASIGALAANVTGNAGAVQLHATVQDLHVPGPRPDILAAAPVTLDVSARLDEPDRPVTFALHHALVSADGVAKTEGVRQVQAHLVLPDLSPFAAIGGVDIRGSTDLDVQAEMKDGTTTATVKGRVGITGGMAPAPALIGADGSIDLAASLHGEDITLSRLMVNGKALSVSAQGSLTQAAESSATAGNATSGNATPGNASPGNAALDNATPGNATSGNATSGNATPGNATSGNASPRNAGPGNASSPNTTPGHATPGSSAAGTSGQTLNADWTIALSDLAAVQPDLSGRV
ncbi:MAG: translocation and assembly module TamB, partial [Acetobacteraceae bacterium]|nr:translocation and assembly module TamB [Acetobacteraceae bacterium]